MVPLFVDRLLDGGQLVDKARVLGQAARGRHFAVYFRDEKVQTALTDLAITGDLSPTKHDYLGVFTQNTNGSKADYWQSRRIRSSVDLRKDGSARVTLEVEIHNDSAPYVGPEPDPQLGYLTRWATYSIGSFLPLGARVTDVSVDGSPIEFVQGDYFGRPYVRHTLEFAPQQRRTMRLEYDVRGAAKPTGGGLTYRLDLDPQGMVRPQAVTTRVQFPSGFELGSLPGGWRRDGRRSATWSTDALDETTQLALRAGASR